MSCWATQEPNEHNRPYVNVFSPGFIYKATICNSIPFLLIVWYFHYRYHVMLLCWQNCPEERPTFKELRVILHNILHTKAVGNFMQAVAILWYFKVFRGILITFTLFIFISEDLYQRWIFWRTGHNNWRGPFVKNDIQSYSPVANDRNKLTDKWRPVNCL